MMSAFFHFQHTLNRLFNNCIKSYWYLFFLKYQIDPSPQEKLPSKSLPLLGLRIFYLFWSIVIYPWQFFFKRVRITFDSYSQFNLFLGFILIFLIKIMLTYIIKQSFTYCSMFKANKRKSKKDSSGRCLF